MIVELEQAVARVRDGDRVGVGGAVLSRKPMAAIRALAAAGRRDLELVTFAGSLEVEELLAAGALSAVRSSYVGLGPHGPAPLFADAVANETVEDLEESEWMLLGGLRAAAAGMPFLPTRAGLGSELVAARGLREVDDPYTGTTMLAIPALRLDVAILHAWRADAAGHIQTPWPPDHLADVDPLLARCAETVIVTVEELVATEQIVSCARDTVLYPFEVDAVAVVPAGAAPTAYPPLYPADAHEINQLAKRDLAVAPSNERK
ncbi:MAG TPA: CoA-transferase [Solirubrobacteraceae bacterium]|nr:CoA-transferase [Solirubrobacteraceae bacterium]